MRKNSNKQEKSTPKSKTPRNPDSEDEKLNIGWFSLFGADGEEAMVAP